MDFLDRIMVLSDTAQKIKGSLKTEEATKTALVLPFLQELGYEIFNPLEVVPEFTADVAGLKGEKVDYAIMHNDKPAIIIECKSCGATLDDLKKEQLHQYFMTVDSCVGILTNGIRYLFFSTSDDGKNMDTLPFMDFNLESIDLTLVPELRKLCKERFDLKKTLETVNELKFVRQIKLILEANLDEPKDNFVIFFIKELNMRAHQKTVEQFLAYTKRAFTEFVDEHIDARLKKALSATSKKNIVEETLPIDNDAEKKGIVSTQEEKEGFQIVRAIVSKVIDPARVFERDTLRYFGILIDDKHTKPLCRLHFNAISVKYIELFDNNGKGAKHKIDRLEDIYNYEDELRATAASYCSV